MGLGLGLGPLGSMQVSVSDAEGLLADELDLVAQTVPSGSREGGGG